MQILDIRDPNLFQRLLRKLMIAEHGINYQVVDDSGGDGGLDGFNRTTGDLHAFYCPEKPAAARYRQKYETDLEKVRQLRDEKQYSVRRFVFVTPEPMREPEQRTLRDLARKENFEDGINLGGEHLEVLLANHPEIIPQFPEISYPQVEQKLDRILRAIEQMQSSQASAPNAQKTSKVAGPAAQILTLAVQAANKTLEGRVEAEEIIRLFDFTKEEYKDAVEELDALGVIGVSKSANAPGGYHRVWIRPAAFVQIAPQVLADLDIKEELKRLLQAFSLGGGEYVFANEILEKSSVPLARAQVLINYLQELDLIETAGLAGNPDSLLFHYGHILPLGKRIIAGKDKLPI